MKCCQEIYTVNQISSFFSNVHVKYHSPPQTVISLFVGEWQYCSSRAKKVKEKKRVEGLYCQY